jgi:nucleoside-diphosphate-sugar epimerase
VEKETPLRPATLYGASKNALRQVAEAFAHATGLEFAWGRIFLTFGPHEDPARLVPSVTRSLLRGEPARCSSGNHLRDFLHVQDVAEAFAALTDSGAEGSFNIGSGEPVAVNDVARELAALVGRDDLLQLGALAEREGDPAVLVADTGRLSKELGWKPRLTLAQGLEHTVSWWRTQVAEPHVSAI